jgi:adenylate kinase
MSTNIVVTGLPGSGTTKFCNDYVELSLAIIDDPLAMKSFNVGDEILRMAQKPQRPPIMPENLLNLHPVLLDALRDRAFDSILSSIGSIQLQGCNRIIINTHGQFFWNDIFTNAYDWQHLAKFDADMFITLIEKPSTIKERQIRTPQGNSQDHDLRDISMWQNMEVNIAAGWAANFGKPFYVLPGQQGPEIIESLLRSSFLIYFQMPMTDASSEADDMISEFKQKVLTIGMEINGLPTPLIDPRTIDIETGEGLSDRERRIIEVQTVHRDMDWYIPEVSDQIAYYPPGTELSKGVSDESTRGFETGRNTFVIDPENHGSPFMDIATRVFTSEEDFFDFYPGYVEERMESLRRDKSKD